MEDFVGRITKIDERYWIEKVSLVRSSIPKKPDNTSGIETAPPPYVYARHTKNPHNPRLKRFEVFSHAQTIRGNPELPI